MKLQLKSNPCVIGNNIASGIQRLRVTEQRLTHKIGQKRVEELRAFSQKLLSSHDEVSFKQTMNQDDKKLTWVWFRLQRLNHTVSKKPTRKTVA